jgi:hypothetical protein
LSAFHPLRTLRSRGTRYGSMTRDDLLALIAGVFRHEPQLAPGGVLVGHTPHVAEFAYLARVYDPAPPDQVRAWATAHDMENPYLSFLAEVANGLRVANVSLRGVITHIDRSVRGVGQPVSVDHGNIFGRPASLDQTDMVIGGIVGWSSKGSYVMDREGTVRLTHHLDGADVAAGWPDLHSMLRSELTRIARLHDRQGRELGTSTDLMHPKGRHWETKVEPGSTRH